NRRPPRPSTGASHYRAPSGRHGTPLAGKSTGRHLQGLNARRPFGLRISGTEHENLIERCKPATCRRSGPVLALQACRSLGKAEGFLQPPVFRGSLTRLGPREIMVQFGCGVWTLDPPPGQEALELRASATGHFSRLAKRESASGVQHSGEFLLQLGLRFQRRHPQGLHRFVGNLNRQSHALKHTACPEENQLQWDRALSGSSNPLTFCLPDTLASCVITPCFSGRFCPLIAAQRAEWLQGSASVLKPEADDDV